MPPLRYTTYRSTTGVVRQRFKYHVTHHNRTAGPFTWTATADSILGKLKRLAAAISESQH